MKLIEADKVKQAEIEPEAISKWKKEFREYVDSLDITRDDWKGIIEYINDVPTVHPDTTTHDSIPAEKGGNDEYRTTDDYISRQQAINAIRDYLVGKRCPDDGTLTCRLIENEVINKLPSAQPEIIRCKDCLMHGVCRFEQGLGLDGYCSQTKRRTDE